MKFFLEHEGGTIAVVSGELGFYPIVTKLSVDELNSLPDEVAESALAASMFGWHTPAAYAALAWEKNHE